MRQKVIGLRRRHALTGYLFISPFIIGFLVFMVQPLCQSFWMSLCEVQISNKGFSMVLNQLYNYRKAFTVDPEFNRMLTEAVSTMVSRSLGVMVFSFFVALLLKEKFKGRALARAIFFLPVILSSGVLVGLEFNNSLMDSLRKAIERSSNVSSITRVLEAIMNNSGFGISDNMMERLFSLVNSIYDVAMASGIQIIIYLSALQNIPASLYEAADMEGCTRWERLWKITFPMVSPLLLVCWIYTIIDFFMKTDNEILSKINQAMIIRLDYGFSSAMAWIYFGVVILLISASSFFISKAVYYYE
jgi:ABC-type sugar transport system permease subunit